jgi:hypothetical protein
MSPEIQAARKAGEEWILRNRDQAELTPFQRAGIRSNEDYHRDSLTVQRERNAAANATSAATLAATKVNRDELQAAREERIGIARMNALRSAASDQAGVEQKGVENQRAAEASSIANQSMLVKNLTDRFSGQGLDPEKAKARAQESYDLIQSSLANEYDILSKKKVPLNPEERARLVMLTAPGGHSVRQAGDLDPHILEKKLQSIAIKRAFDNSRQDQEGFSWSGAGAGALTGAATALRAPLPGIAKAGAALVGGLAGGYAAGHARKTTESKPTNDIDRYNPDNFKVEGDYLVSKDGKLKIHMKDLTRFDDHGDPIPTGRAMGALRGAAGAVTGDALVDDRLTRLITR